MTAPNLKQETIARRAYEIWQQRGQPEGQSEEIWFAAEDELRESAGSDAPRGDTAAPAPNPPATNTGSSDAAQTGSSLPRTDPGGKVTITEMERGLAPGDRQRARSKRRTGARGEERPGGAGEHFYVLVDRAHLRILRNDPNASAGSGTMEMVEAIDLPAGHRGYTDQESDMAGRFPGSRGVAVGGTAPAGQSIDERLPLQHEHERQIVTELAGHVQMFLNQHPGATWDYAAGPALHRPVIDRLDTAARNRLRLAIQKDLVNQPREELRSHFSTTGGRTRNPAA